MSVVINNVNAVIKSLVNKKMMNGLYFAVESQINFFIDLTQLWI